MRLGERLGMGDGARIPGAAAATQRRPGGRPAALAELPAPRASASATRRPRRLGLLPAAAALGLVAAAAGGALAVGADPAPAAAQVTAPAEGAWIVDPAASRLQVIVGVGGKRMEGAFARWNAEIVFDPDRPDACHVKVTVDVGSLSFPDPMASGSAAEANWLDAAGHPQAVFEGAGFGRIGPGIWKVPGTLTLKGETRPLTLDLRIAAKGDAAEADVLATLARGDFAVGQPGEAMVDAEVSIAAHVVATRAAR